VWWWRWWCWYSGDTWAYKRDHTHLGVVGLWGVGNNKGVVRCNRHMHNRWHGGLSGPNAGFILLRCSA
jgi:hypothetical protein